MSGCYAIIYGGENSTGERVNLALVYGVDKKFCVTRLKTWARPAAFLGFSEESVKYIVDAEQSNIAGNLKKLFRHDRPANDVHEAIAERQSSAYTHVTEPHAVVGSASNEWIVNTLADNYLHDHEPVNLDALN